MTVDWPMLLAFAQVLLSWPPMALIIAVVLGALFRKELRGLLGRVRKAKFAGAELEAEAPVPQQQITPPEPPVPQAPPDELDRYILEHPREVRLELARLSTTLRFVQLYAVIYGTQLRLLDRLRAAGPGGLPMTEVELWYQEHAKQMPEGVAAQPFPIYVGFLTTPGLIELRNGGATITKQGLEFLQYIEATYNLPLARPY